MNIGATLNAVRVDMFALYMKTKNFDWRVWGPDFRDYHDLLDQQAKQIYATTNAIAERVSELGATTFPDYYLLLDERANQISPATEAIAVRVRRFETTTSRFEGYISSLPRLLANGAQERAPVDMFDELREDNLKLVASLRRTRALCEEYADAATVILIETWTDQAEDRVRLLCVNI